MALNLSTRRGSRVNGENLLPGTKFGLKYKSAKRHSQRQVSLISRDPLCDVTNTWTPALPHLSDGDDGDDGDDDDGNCSTVEENGNGMPRLNKYRLEISGLIHPDDLVGKGGKGKGKSKGKGQRRREEEFTAGGKSTGQDMIQMVRGKHQLLYGLRDGTADPQVLRNPPSPQANYPPCLPVAYVDSVNENLPTHQGVYCLPSTLHGATCFYPVHSFVDSHYAPPTSYETLLDQSQAQIPVTQQDPSGQLPHPLFSGLIGLRRLSGIENGGLPTVREPVTDDADGEGVVFQPRLLSDESNGSRPHPSVICVGSEEPEIRNHPGTICHGGSSSCPFSEIGGRRHAGTWSPLDARVDPLQQRASNGRPENKRRSRKHSHSYEESEQSSKDDVTLASTSILDLEDGPDFKPRYASFRPVSAPEDLNGASVARHFPAPLGRRGGGAVASPSLRGEDLGQGWSGGGVEGKSHRQELCLSPDIFASQNPSNTAVYDHNHNHHAETYRTTSQPAYHSDATTNPSPFPLSHDHHIRTIFPDDDDHLNATTSYDHNNFRTFPAVNQTPPPPPWERHEPNQGTGHAKGTHDEPVHGSNQARFSPKLSVTRAEDSYQSGPSSVLRVSLLEGELALDPAEWRVAHKFKGFLGRKTKLITRETDDLACPRPYLATEELLHLYTSP